MSINWREKIFAASIHFVITLAVAALAAAVIFLVWFPGAFASMSGGTDLFLLVVGVDVGLGPLVSLVIYSSRKSRRQLIIDYSVVAFFQLAALLYGVFTVAVSRPVFVAFAVDQFEVVAAIELDDADLAAGTEPRFRTKSWTGPRLVAVQMPTDPKERDQQLELTLSGKEVQMLPKYYRAYEVAREQIDAKSAPLDSLFKEWAAQRERIERAIRATGIPRSELRWLGVRHRFGYAAALIDPRTRQPVQYVPLETMK